ncbi:uncharacterized protein [Solanum lycopersicum]|uniref:uncharacterized protein n=1 Tax=Solanum lycopersicum TaxID=4081 RepID=UPI003749E7B6
MLTSHLRKEQKGLAPSSASALAPRNKGDYTCQNLQNFKSRPAQSQGCEEQGESGVSLSFVDPYVAMNFDAIPEQLSEPFSVSTLVGLKVRGNTNDFKYPEPTNCMLFQKYFPGAVTSVTKHQLAQRFKMATLDNTTISSIDFLMVEDGRYQHFPWGQLSFSKLIGSLRHDFDVSKKLYRLYRMLYALNVWIYECASNLNSEIVVKERNVIPRICNWRVVSDKAKFEMLMSTIFQENACSNIVPTAEEIEAFDLAQVEHAHSSSLPLVQPNEEDDFDNFSTKPPKQLLRTYSRVSDTSPPPPPKKKKKRDYTKKEDVSLKSAADVHGSIPDVSLNPAANVHGSADSQNVDKKFEKLIILIKEDHSQLMQSIGKKNINFQANTSTFQSDKQTSQHISIDLSDMGSVAEDGVGFSGKNGEHQIVDDAGDVTEDGVGVSVNEGEQLVSDTPKDGDAHQSHQDLNEHIMEQEVDDNVQHNIPHVLPEKTTMNASESSISTTISPSTQASIDALIKDLGKDPTNARPLYFYNPQNITSSQYLLTDSQLPTDIPITEIGVRTDSVTPAHRNRMPSIRIQSPYCTSFGSSEKGKDKLKDMARLHFPFEGCGITD